MLKKEHRLKSIHISFNNQKQIQHVHACKDCGSEIFKTATEEKISKGYCVSCTYKHRKPKTVKRNIEGFIICKKCNSPLEDIKFPKVEGKSGQYFKSICIQCANLRKFGINSNQYVELLKTQNYSCAVCGKPEMAKDKNKLTERNLAVDHCHYTKKVRGLLCTNCNIMLGHCKDNKQILLNAIKYLEKI